VMSEVHWRENGLPFQPRRSPCLKLSNSSPSADYAIAIHAILLR
jgi:hypothetical protein